MTIVKFPDRQPSAPCTWLRSMDPPKLCMRRGFYALEALRLGAAPQVLCAEHLDDALQQSVATANEELRINPLVIYEDCWRAARVAWHRHVLAEVEAVLAETEGLFENTA